MGPLWEIVGGTAQGGILARSGRETGSAQLTERLGKGARVEELELAGDRLHYRLLSGPGPMEGWVSVKANGKVLAEKLESPVSLAELEGSFGTIEMESSVVHIGEVNAVVHKRPDGAPKAPLSVVLVPGNPVINSYHADMPMMIALEGAFVKIGLPTVRFDYDGVGMSAPGNEPPTQDYRVTRRDTRDVIEWAKACLSDRVVTCGWNYGGSPATLLAREKMPGLHALLFVSWGYNIWMMMKQMGDPTWEILKEEYEAHTTLEQPAMYVFGEKDSFTPKGHVQRICKARPDGGARTQVSIIKQEEPMNKTEYFQLKNKEEEAAQVCATWVRGLCEELALSESTLIGA